MDAPGASSSAAAATSSAINPFDLPPQTVSLAESAAVRSPFEFSDVATDMANAFSTSISQSAFRDMCAELVGAPLPAQPAAPSTSRRLMKKSRPRASSVGASPSKEGLSTHIVNRSTWKKAASKHDKKSGETRSIQQRLWRRPLLHTIHISKRMTRRCRTKLCGRNRLHMGQLHRS